MRDFKPTPKPYRALVLAAGLQRRATLHQQFSALLALIPGGGVERGKAFLVGQRHVCAVVKQGLGHG